MNGSLYAVAKKWSAIVLVLLLVAFSLTPISYMADSFFLVWILTGIAVLYRAKNAASEPLQRWLKGVFVLVGLGSCAMSFASIPLGIGKPPYSLDDFTLLLAGVSLIAFALKDYSPLTLPATIPIAVVLGYQILGSSPAAWAQPLLQPTVSILAVTLKAIGLNPTVDGTLISFYTREGARMRMSIVPDCTGIWSLMAYSVAVVTIAMIFHGIKPGGYALIALGFPATYLVNIIRVTAIFVSGYFFGNGGVTRASHIHIGWIVFSAWMFAFWYVFFYMKLHKKD